MEPRDPARKPRPLSLDMSLDPLAQAAQVLLANQDQPMWLCCLENGLNLAKFAASLVCDFSIFVCYNLICNIKVFFLVFKIPGPDRNIEIYL